MTTESKSSPTTENRPSFASAYRPQRGVGLNGRTPLSSFCPHSIAGALAHRSVWLTALDLSINTSGSIKRGASAETARPQRRFAKSPIQPTTHG
jgi:hypothetical protein